MKDAYGRQIDYMRLSITDRCNLRCRYCMPGGIRELSHESILRYEEFLRICRAAIRLGIDRFKVTGGEPFSRLGAAEFMAELKKAPGVRCVTLTTNGVLLEENLPALIRAGIDGVNISLDSLRPSAYRDITGFDRAEKVLQAVRSCAGSGIKTKINTVLLEENLAELGDIAALAEKLPVDVRFIELMPIGEGRKLKGPGADEALSALREIYPDLSRSYEKRGNGPAVYFSSAALKGRIGFIGANSHKFCSGCNRVRVTSTGLLKPCLCYSASTDLRGPLRTGASDEELEKLIASAVYSKPAAHCFSQEQSITENGFMNQIGG